MELLPEAQFAYGELDVDVRREYLADLERKLRPVLIATTLADEGYPPQVVAREYTPAGIIDAILAAG